MTESRKTVKGEYKTYVLKSSQKLEQMEVLLKRNKIEFAYADASQKRRALTIRRRNRKVYNRANDLIVKVDQPRQY
jgi:hypothetical protein